MKLSEDVLTQIATRAGGDYRAAINDMQGRAVADYESDDRNREESIVPALMKVLKTTKFEVAINALDNVDLDMDKRLLWVEENMAREYLIPLDLSRAFDALSLADVFRGRIRRWQYWRAITLHICC